MQAARPRLKDERSADVRVIFDKVNDRISSDTGKVTSGHLCTVCK